MSGDPLPPPNAPQPAPPAGEKSGITIPEGEQLVGVIAAAVAVLAAFMPWYEARTAFGSISANGIDGDGQITVVAAIIGLLTIWKGGKMLVGAAICGAIVGGVGGWHIYSNSDELSIGLGLYATTGAGIVLFAMAMTILDRERRARRNYPA